MDFFVEYFGFIRLIALAIFSIFLLRWIFKDGESGGGNDSYSGYM